MHEYSEYQYYINEETFYNYLLGYKFTDNEFYENTHFISKNKKLLARYSNKQLITIKPRTIYGITTKYNPEQALALEDILNDDILLLAITGHAGTGKTFIALLGSIFTQKQIVFTREVIEVGRSLGFLPGYIDDKFDPYMRPFKDNKTFITQSFSEKEKKKLEERIETIPLQFLRGGTLTNTILIVDEAQNCSVDTLKMAISRAGMGSKVILCGSLEQIDNKELNKQTNGLTKVIEAFKGEKCFSHIHLYKNERGELATLADKLL